jgi:uncharacterized protein (TIGR01777 family)
MEHILITGGTGLVGKRLTQLLTARGYYCIILTRSIKNKLPTSQIEYVKWDVKNKAIDIDAVQKADYILHLAGAGVLDKRWTKAYKQEIVDSRTKSSELLIETLKNNTHHVKTLISASAIGWYGPDKIADHFFMEDEVANDDFLGETCKVWEQSVSPAIPLGIRVCSLRTGIVLSKDGGALAEFTKPIKFGIAAILGSGKQIISWIHIDDLCNIYIDAIENTALQGSYNAVAPEPVSNKTLTTKLAKAIKGNFYIAVHVPKFILKIMLGESSIEVLKSTTISASKIKSTGFTFIYPTIDAAINELTK